MSRQIQRVPAKEKGRPETGPMQFGDDWPGVFIRGDRAMYWAIMLRQAIQEDAGASHHTKAALGNMADLLASCRI